LRAPKKWIRLWAAAREAFPEWRATALSGRMEIMFRFRELVNANRRGLAELITLEHGKTLADAMGEVARDGERRHGETPKGLLGLDVKAFLAP
jgi:acyl-CoA reductase-like NAD-dependent aldehyde dehydrogenase